MEYVQMTLTDWMEVKQRLKMELQGVTRSFVRIGYVLRKIEEQRLYENDGYKSVAEFAKAEYGLEASTVSRFMSINREYSIDGYSEHLREEYIDMSRSQLEEMLKLPVADRTMIQPETARDDIRELKKFNKTEPAAGVADDITQLIEKFYEDNPEVLNELFDTEMPPREQGVTRAIEVVNPGGNRSYKKGMFFLMMYENKIAIKKFGTTPEEMTWGRFFEITFSIFEDYGPKTWEKHFGKELEPVAVEEEKNEPVAVQEEHEKNVEKEPEKEIARAQKNEENQGFAGDLEEKKDNPEEPIEEQIPGQMSAKDYPEMMPEAAPVAVQEEEDANKSEHGDSAGVAESIREPEDSGRTEGERNEVPGREPETPQSNEQSGQKERYEEVRQYARDRIDAVHAVFRGWENEKKIPKEELEMALKNARNLVNAIETLILMTGEQ